MPEKHISGEIHFSGGLRLFYGDGFAIFQLRSAELQTAEFPFWSVLVSVDYKGYPLSWELEKGGKQKPSGSTCTPSPSESVRHQYYLLGPAVKEVCR